MIPDLEADFSKHLMITDLNVNTDMLQKSTTLMNVFKILRQAFKMESQPQNTELGRLFFILHVYLKMMRFPTMWYVRPTKAQISLRICSLIRVFASCLNIQRLLSN